MRNLKMKESRICTSASNNCFTHDKMPFKMACIRKGVNILLINLREKRIEKGFTQESLATKAGCVRQTISNIECGVNMPSASLAQALGEILEFNWWEFFSEGNER